MKRLVLIILLIPVSLFYGYAYENWKINIRGAIFSTPFIHGNTMYIGTEEGFFYWVDVSTGRIVHEVKVGGPIRSNALVLDDNVFVESQGQLFCFDAATAQQKYTITPEEAKIDMVDPFDYFHTSPVEHSGVIYFAGNNGVVYGVNPTKGEVIKTIETPEKVAIHCALTFSGDNLYFGDFNGVVYEYSMVTETFTMVHKTFGNRLYSTYGFITGGPLVYDGKLIFGSRNNKFTLLNLKTREVAWSRIDGSGSWWPLTPVIIDDKVIIGGSDNFLLSALNVNSGEIYWNYKTDYNMFCKPLVINNILIVGTGDSYLNRKGDGSVFSIDTKTGILINKFKPEGNIFSSPTKSGSSIIICTTQGNIYNINERFFTNPQPSKVSIKGDVEVTFSDNGTSILDKQLILNNTGEKAVRISHTTKTDGSFTDTLLRVDGERDLIYANGSRILNLQFNRANLKPGEYKGEIIFSTNSGSEPIIKPFSIKVQGSGRKNEPDFEIFDFVVDNQDCSATYNLKAYKKINAIGLLTPVKSDSIVGYIIMDETKWGNYKMRKDIFPSSSSKIKNGNYRLVFRSKDHKVVNYFTKN